MLIPDDVGIFLVTFPKLLENGQNVSGVGLQKDFGELHLKIRVIFDPSFLYGFLTGVLNASYNTNAGPLRFGVLN